MIVLIYLVVRLLNVLLTLTFAFEWSRTPSLNEVSRFFFVIRNLGSKGLSRKARYSVRQWDLEPSSYTIATSSITTECMLFMSTSVKFLNAKHSKHDYIILGCRQ